MPNIKSAIKRVKVNEKNRAHNAAKRSEMRTYMKKFHTALTGGDLAAAEKALKDASKKLDKAASKGLIHKNKAARHKSRMAHKLNQAKQDQSA